MSQVAMEQVLAEAEHHVARQHHRMSPLAGSTIAAPGVGKRTPSAANNTTRCAAMKPQTAERRFTAAPYANDRKFRILSVENFVRRQLLISDAGGHVAMSRLTTRPNRLCKQAGTHAAGPRPACGYFAASRSTAARCFSAACRSRGAVVLVTRAPR